MSVGGVPGPGEDFRTLPWSALRFEPRRDADVLDGPDAQLGAPPPRAGTDPARVRRLTP